MPKRFEGRNLEDALERAAQAFNVERYRLSYHVVLEKRGFLGGMKRVVIEAEVNESAVPPPAAPQREEFDDDRQPDFPPPQREAFPPLRPRERGEGRGRGRRSRRSRGGERRPAPPPRRSQAPREAVPEQGAQSDQAAVVHQWCEELFDHGRLDLEARTSEDDQRIVVKLYGPDAKLVLAHGGELLDSIQVLANKALSARGVEKDIEVDCRDFKEQRLSDLGRRAREVADLVRRDGKEHLLEAMSPVERRIVHLALAEDSDVATESRGEGFYKRVAVVPRKEEEPNTAQP